MERHGVTVALWLCQPASERPGPLASHWQAQVPGTPGGPGHVPVVSDSRNSLSVFPAEFCPARAGTDVTAQNRVKSCGNHPPQVLTIAVASQYDSPARRKGICSFFARPISRSGSVKLTGFMFPNRTLYRKQRRPTASGVN